MPLGAHGAHGCLQAFSAGEAAVMGRRAVAAVAVAAMALTGCSADDPPGGEGRLSIATGGSGGVYQVYGGAFADQLASRAVRPAAMT